MFTHTHKSTVVIPLTKVELPGDISVPQHAHGMIIFAHGSGSSRLSPRNRMVASYLNDHGFATLLFDLLTPEEDRIYSNRFNIELLAQRLIDVAFWVMDTRKYQGLRVGFFGASTGAAAALLAARDLPEVAAVVSRGGRPDLAMKALPFVKSPTLLIVGDRDTDVLRLNQQALRAMNCRKKIVIVPGATHLFEENGAMEQVCSLATEWFELNLQPLELFD
jgi:putative phosphoribosyl transferase